MFGLLFSLLCAFVFQNVQAAGSNASGIQFSDDGKKPADLTSARRCRGVLPGSVQISNIGLSSNDLEHGVPCIAEDFDGNGSLDFLIYGPYSDSTKRREALAIFFSGGSVIGTQEFPYALELFTLDDPERSRYPKNKDTVGLIHHPAQNNGIVYFFSKKHRKFKKHSYIYSNGLPLGD